MSGPLSLRPTALVSHTVMSQPNTLISEATGSSEIVEERNEEEAQESDDNIDEDDEDGDDDDASYHR